YTVIDAAMRTDADLLESQVVLRQLVEAGKGERDVIEARRIRLALGQRPGIEEGDPVMLVVIADERYALGLVKDFGSEQGAVPIDHLPPAIGLQHDMRQFFG